MTGVSTDTAPASRRGFGAYGATVSGLGALLLCALAVTGESLPLGDWRFWLMGALLLVGELMPIDVPRRDGADRVAISTAFAFALLLEFGLLAAVLAYAAASVIADVHARLSPVKITFNAAQYALSLAASALTLAVLGQEPPIESIAAALPAVLASAAVFFVVNHVLAGVGVALIIGESPAHYLLSDLPFQVLSAGFVLAISPVVVASAETSMSLVPLALLPVLALWIGARRAALDTHRAFHDALTDLPEPPAAAPAARARAGAGARRARIRSRCCSSTSTTSRPSTTRSGTPTATACSATSPPACAPRSAATTCSRASAATSSPCCPAARATPSAAAPSPPAWSSALQEPFEVDGILLDVRASVGLACFPEHGSAPDELLRGADVALYVAKAAQSPVEVYSSGKDHYTVDRLMLAAQLRRGLEMGELVLEYQPKFPLRGGPAVGVEALARWEHPTLGRIGPDGFIPLAEQTGLIARVTDVVMRQAIEQAAAWAAEGLKLRMSVNVSPRNLLDPHLPGLIRTLLAEAGVRPVAAAARDHREPLGPERPRRDGRPRGAAHDGRGPRDRRLRHRLLLARAAPAPAGRRDQDRPLVRVGDDHQRERRDDRALDHRPRPQPRPDRHRGGRRGPADPPPARRHGLRPRAGLRALPPAAARPLRHTSSATPRSCSRPSPRSRR